MKKTNNLFDLQDKVALITGGAGLLAAEHALALHEFGAKIILADISLEKAQTVINNLKNENCDVDFIVCDVTSKSSWEQALEFILKKHNKIDILINNAGFTNQSKSANFDALR